MGNIGFGPPQAPTILGLVTSYKENPLDLARRRRDFFLDLGTLFSKIVDFFVEIVDFFTEIVDTHLFVERVPGGLDNRRHVSTIH